MYIEICDYIYIISLYNSKIAIVWSGRLLHDGFIQYIVGYYNNLKLEYNYCACTRADK